MPTKKGFFAIRLKELRIAATLSQSALAECSGVPVGTIRYFEYGLREPTYETLIKLARGLKVDLNAFDQPNRQTESPENKKEKRKKEK